VLFFSRFSSKSRQSSTTIPEI